MVPTPQEKNAPALKISSDEAFVKDKVALGLVSSHVPSVQQPCNCATPKVGRSSSRKKTTPFLQSGPTGKIPSFALIPAIEESFGNDGGEQKRIFSETIPREM